MSNPVTTVTQILPAVPNPVVVRKLRLFLTTFGVLIVAFLAFFVFVYSFGVSTGFEGQMSFSWDQLGATLGFLFGGVVPALAMIGGMAVVVALFWVVDWLHRTGRRKRLLLTFALGIIALGFAITPLTQVDWANIGFGILPFLVLVAFTALVSGVIVVALSPIPSRKRDTNH